MNICDFPKVSAVKRPVCIYKVKRKEPERLPHPVLLMFYWLVNILSCTCLGCSGAQGTWPIGHPSPAIWTKVHYKVTVEWYLVDLAVFCYSVCCSRCHNKPRLISARRRVQGCLQNSRKMQTGRGSNPPPRSPRTKPFDLPHPTSSNHFSSVTPLSLNLPWLLPIQF